jgi:hypothetical protein
VAITAHQNLGSGEEWGGWAVGKVGARKVMSSGQGWEGVVNGLVIGEKRVGRWGGSGEELRGKNKWGVESGLGR